MHTKKRTKRDLISVEERQKKADGKVGYNRLKIVHKSFRWVPYDSQNFFPPEEFEFELYFANDQKIKFFLYESQK